jgi:subtilisin-like proprotein convertase family protein
MMPTGGYENTTPFPIPDNEPTGIRSEITVPDGGTIMALSVTASITHTYRGDLRVVLVRDGREVVLHDREGGGEDDLSQTWSVDDFNGDDGAGTWTLSVSDHAGADTGTLESWSIEITR